MRCPTCGAANPESATWCGQCHAPLAGPAAAAPAAAVVGRPVPRQEPLRAAPTYSRWRKSSTTFGPVGRLLWTLGVLLVMAVAVLTMDPLVIGPLCFIAAPLVLRSVWAKGQVA